MNFNCSFPPNTIIANITTGNGTIQPLYYSNFTTSRDNIQSCGAPTSLRPHDGDCLMPWPYTLAWILVHFPITLLRVNRWERVQTLSLILAFFTLFITIQSYTTKMTPELVLVWMPLAIVLDIGAMMQLVYLLVEENGVVLLLLALRSSTLGLIWRKKSTSPDQARLSRHQAVECDKSMYPIQTWIMVSWRLMENLVPVVELEPDPIPAGEGLVRKAWICAAALLTGLVLLILQLYGLVSAAQGRRARGLKAIWCSTMFQSSLSVSSNCELYPISLSKSPGTGCIELPAIDKQRWLEASVAVLSVSLLFEAFDALILISVSNNTCCWNGARRKRPWFTMFAGNAILLAVLITGVFQALSLPYQINKHLSVFRYEGSIGAATVCSASILPPGVRGSIIGWTDGFLNSWGETYKPIEYMEN
jgi:hypothetical protein